MTTNEIQYKAIGEGLKLCPHLQGFFKSSQGCVLNFDCIPSSVLKSTATPTYRDEDTTVYVVCDACNVVEQQIQNERAEWDRSAKAIKTRKKKAA